MSNMSAYMSTVASYLKLPMIASSSLALLLSGALYFKQNDLIYPRDIPSGSRTDIYSPDTFGITSWEDVTIPTPDGETLAACLVKPADCPHPRPVTIMMFHGNAGNISHRLPIAQVLESKLGCNVLLVEYRGYGQSTGSPNEKGLQIDAQAGLDYLLSRDDLKNTSIVIHGQSLGGAVAVHLASKNAESGKIKALILENTFLSIRKMIPSAFPPAKYLAPLCHEIWPNEELLPTIKNIPILFLSGRRDEIVPAEHMDLLYNACQATDKEFVKFATGTHNTTVQDPKYFTSIHIFLTNHLYRPALRSSAVPAKIRVVNEPAQAENVDPKPRVADNARDRGSDSSS